MSPAEVAGLLAWLSVLDRRYAQPDDATLALAAEAWHELLPDALEARDAKLLCVRMMRSGEHVTAPSLRHAYERAVTPAHRQGVDRLPTPLEPFEPRPLALDGPVDGQEGTVDAIPRRSGSRVRVDALSVSCPHCRAFERVPCRSGGRPLATPHPSRYEAAGLPDPILARTERAGYGGKERAAARAALASQRAIAE